MIPVDVIVNYVFKHPKYSLMFPGWDRKQIVYAIVQASIDDELYVCTHNDQVAGILIADVKDAEQEIYVKHVLCTKGLPAFDTFVTAWFQKYPTYTVVGLRQGSKRVKYSLKNFRYERRHKVFSFASELAGP